MRHDAVSPPDVITSSRLCRLAPAIRQTAASVVDRLLAIPAVNGAVLQGSIARGDSDHLSDIDLILVATRGRTPSVLQWVERIGRELDVAFVGHTDRYSWFGKLVSLYWQEPVHFACDVGVIDDEELPVFNLETTAVVLKDDRGTIASRLLAIHQAPPVPPMRNCGDDDRQFMVYGLLYKSRKSLHRGHVWNAMEYLSQLRRLYMAITRPDALLHNTNKLPAPRVDRDFEDHAPVEVLDALRTTAVAYDVRAVAHAVAHLARLVLASDAAQGWEGRDALLPLIRSVEDVEGLGQTRE